MLIFYCCEHLRKKCCCVGDVDIFVIVGGCVGDDDVSGSCDGNVGRGGYSVVVL